MKTRGKRIACCLLLALAVLLCAGCGAPVQEKEAAAPTGAMEALQPRETDQVTEPPAEVTPKPTDPPDYAPQVVSSFMYYWSIGDYPSMVSLCSVTWSAKMDSEQAVSAMVELLEDRQALNYEVTRVSGSNSDLRRDAYVTAEISKGGGAAQKYQFKLKMIWENNFWYIDPGGLKSYAGTATPTARSAEITQPPTPAPIDDPNTLLYYNPDGGDRYHLDPYCRAANERYLPFKGSFTYAELNDPQYADLHPCQICGAPRRPK